MNYLMDFHFRIQLLETQYFACHITVADNYFEPNYKNLRPLSRERKNVPEGLKSAFQNMLIIKRCITLTTI